VFHAGTIYQNGKLLTGGGRVLGISSCAKNLSQAIKDVYQAIEPVHFEGIQYRKDIGAKGLKY
jgi:phosphoribosylamine--glycine ligase